MIDYGHFRDVLDATFTITICGCIAAILLGYWTLSGHSEKPADFSIAIPEQCTPGWTGKPLDKPDIKVSGSTAIQCYAPATGQLLSFVNPLTADGIDRLVSRATQAQVAWSQTSSSVRRRVLKTLLKYVLDNQEVIARAACLDSGKTRVDALFGEILVTAEKLRWTIKHGEKALKAERRPTNLLMFYKHNEVRYEPLGVLGACVSWNYPFHNLLGPIISALSSGNAIIVKSSEQTAWSSQFFVSFVRAALSACHQDPDVVHAFSCWPQTAGHFTSHSGIKHLTFIGSKPIAHEVAKSAAKPLTPLCVELGGKDAAIVLDHPSGKLETPEEMRRITSTLMRGVFQSAGQNCIGIERIIAMPQAHRRLVPLLRERISRLRLGNDLDEVDIERGVDMGAMISPASFDRLEQLIAEAVTQGAKLLIGGHRFHHDRHPNGYYFEPTMLINVTASMRIAQEELFAPICVLMCVENVDEAVNVANSTSYGLGCSVFGPTSGLECRTQMDRVVKEVQAGMVAVNDFAVYYAVQLPFGGVKGSGYGRFAGQEGLRSLCNVKSVCTDRVPSLIQTSIPAKLDYPMRAGAWEMGRGVVEFGYGESWTRMWQGIRRMVRS